MRHGPNPKSDTLDQKKYPSRPQIFFSALYIPLVKSLLDLSISRLYLRLTSYLLKLDSQTKSETRIDRTSSRREAKKIT